MKRIKVIGLALIASIVMLAVACKSDTAKTKDGGIQVAVYYFPNWGPVEVSEWSKVINARPCFEGHRQPNVPLWGYEDENLPSVMEKKIEAAASHGIDVFVFDWYYTDAGKYLSTALEEGFWGAKNNSSIKFALMWCNHDVIGQSGIVKPETFEEVMDYVIEKYFKHPSYWLIDGCPYFSFYLMKNMIAIYGNDYTKASEAIELFRTKVKDAGFKDLHLNGMLSGIKADKDFVVNNLHLDSYGSYHTLTNITGPSSFPTMDYDAICDEYFKEAGAEGKIGDLPVPYHLNVSMGYDCTPRCNNNPEWLNMKDSGYPYGAVIAGNTPDRFKKALERAKELTLKKPANERIIMINSWNEWGEGSYLEPDTVNKMGYLEAIRDVFSKKIIRNN